MSALKLQAVANIILSNGGCDANKNILQAIASIGILAPSNANYARSVRNVRDDDMLWYSRYLGTTGGGGEQSSR